ncbi:UNVERIFIED_CONTAM: hypothetical protein GTU68_029347 [Idotea baltica]|nr:hypothetical protein [Idotea baltica]
MSGRGKEER